MIPSLLLLRLLFLHLLLHHLRLPTWKSLNDVTQVVATCGADIVAGEEIEKFAPTTSVLPHRSPRASNVTTVQLHYQLCDVDKGSLFPQDGSPEKSDDASAVVVAADPEKPTPDIGGLNKCGAALIVAATDDKPWLPTTFKSSHVGCRNQSRENSQAACGS